MLKFNLEEDQALQNVVNIFISALLPHDYFDPSMFSNILGVLQKYIHLDEFELGHRIILDALVQLNKLKISLPEFEPKLDRSVMESLLESNMFDTIMRTDLGIKEWLNYEGLGTNMSVPTDKSIACQKLFAKTMELYDECFELAVPSNEVLNREPELRQMFLQHASASCINTQADILQNEARIGRKKLHGAEDWLDHTVRMTTEIQKRLDESDDGSVVRLDTVEGSYQLLKGLKELMIPIADYGIPEIDAYTPILRHRLVVVVGAENIGKTKFAVDKSTNVLIAGGRVAYMCGESHKAQVYSDIIINYIWKKFNLVIRPSDLVDPESCPDEVRKVIGMAIDTIVTQGGLSLCDAFNYGTLFTELTALYENTKFDMVVIDHSCALVGTVGTGSVKDKVDKLAEDCRNFKKKFPVCVMVTSHPSTAGKQTAKVDRKTDDSPTKGSQNLSTEADEVFYLRDNETLAKQDLIMLENTKRRNAGRIEDPIILRKRFAVSAFIYEPSMQSGESKISIQRDEALRALDEQLAIDDDDAFTLES